MKSDLKKSAFSKVPFSGRGPIAPPTAGRARPQGIGAFIRDLISKGVPDDDILVEVRKTFPDSRAKASDVSWNRRKLAAENGTAKVVRSSMEKKMKITTRTDGRLTTAILEKAVKQMKKAGEKKFADLSREITMANAAPARVRQPETVPAYREPLAPTTRPKFTAVGAYIFAGGFTLGVKDHFNVRAHFEDGPYGREVISQNFPKLPVYDDPATWPLDVASGVDFIYGNPPCAAWSPLGRVIQAGADAWKTDPRVDCTRRLFELLEKCEPRVWAWESVTQAFTRGRNLVDDLTSRALDLGYAVDYFLHDGQYLGVPQRRRRFFMVASKVDVTWHPPKFDSPPTADEALAAYRGPKDGAEDWYRSYGKTRWKKFLKLAKPGESLRGVWEKYVEKYPDEVPPGRWGFSHVRWPVGEVAGTYSANCVIHPTEDRAVTYDELQYMCGYPRSYTFNVPVHARGGLMARAVLPPTGRWLGATVRAALTKNEKAPTGRVRIVDYRTAPGKIEVMA